MAQSKQAIAKRSSDLFPSIFSDFFETDRFFSEPFFNNRWLKDIENTLPAVNVRENNKEFKVEFAAPGFAKEDFKVNVDGNLITVNAERETKAEEENERYTRKEFSYNSFSRSFTLPQSVNADAINAHYKDGILKLEIPKKEEARVINSKEIKVA